MYHKDCLIQWIHQNLTCPLCRSSDLLKTHIPSEIKNENDFELKLDEIQFEEEEKQEDEPKL